MPRFFISLTILLLFVGCKGGASDTYRKATGETWGTFYNITYRSPRALTDSIRAVMAQVNRSLSPFCNGSTVDRINRGLTTETDALFDTVFAEARRVSALSGGRFDPTVAPLVNLWGFGYREYGHEPSDSLIADALKAVGIDSCRIVSGHIVKKTPATEFDFSAIAKGFGCDLVADMLRRNGCNDFLVEIGGEMVLSGVNPRGEEWVVQIDAPVAQLHQRADVVYLSDCGVASSGNYRNYRIGADGRRHGHTISPLTGRPYQGELLAVTVVAPTAMTADALATACMAMPLDESRQMIEAIPDTWAVFITADPKGQFKIEEIGK